jgi:hypothetical protein
VTERGTADELTGHLRAVGGRQPLLSILKCRLSPSSITRDRLGKFLTVGISSSSERVSLRAGAGLAAAYD